MRETSVPTLFRSLSEPTVLQRLRLSPDEHEIVWRPMTSVGLVTLLIKERASGVPVESFRMDSKDIQRKTQANMIEDLGFDSALFELEISRGVNVQEPVLLGTKTLDDLDVEAGFQSVAVRSMGGLGDNLIALNVLRQLAPDMRRRNPNCKIGFASRGTFGLFQSIDFVDEWMVAGSTVETLLGDWDMVIDLRYSAQIRRRGQSAVRPSLDGMHCGRFIGEHLPTTLGPYSFKWDGRYLSEQLDTVTIGNREERRLRSKLPDDPFILIANGTDAMFAQRLTKRMSLSLMTDLANELHKEGVGVVQIGVDGVASVKANGAVDLIGNTSLEGVVWLLRQAKGLLCCDNGIMHLASQMNLDDLSIFALFGPTDPIFWNYPKNRHLISETSECPLRPCWFMESWWHLSCIGERRNMLPDAVDVPECMQTFSNDVSAVLDPFLKMLRA